MVERRVRHTSSAVGRPAGTGAPHMEHPARGEEGREEEGGRRREGESKGSSKERLVGDYLPRDGTKSSTAKE